MYQGWVASNGMFIISLRKIGHLVPTIPHLPLPRSRFIFIPHYLCSTTFVQQERNNRIVFISEIWRWKRARFGILHEYIFLTSPHQLTAGFTITVDSLSLLGPSR